MLNIKSEYWIWMLNWNIEYWIWILNLSIEFEYWILILNIAFEYWIWLLNVEYWILNIEYWILNIEYWILNIEHWTLNIDYWMWELNVTGDESNLKESGYIFSLQTSGVFVSTDMLTLMGWGKVFFVVADYYVHHMVGKYLPPGTIRLTVSIVECVISAVFDCIPWHSQS